MDLVFELIEDSIGRLTLRRPGEPDVLNVRLRRSFPWSASDKFISIRTPEGAEVALIEDLNEIDPARRAMIARWLDQQCFIPRIVQIEQVDATLGRQEWRVVTDRGPVQFTVQEREDIRFFPDGRFIVRDADGTLYELPRLNDLDAHSRRAVESVL